MGFLSVQVLLYYASSLYGIGIYVMETELCQLSTIFEKKTKCYISSYQTKTTFEKDASDENFQSCRSDYFKG